MTRLMIAEDEAIERKALRFLINKYYGEKIEIIGETINGKDTVNRALELKPDIILLDINMPLLNGLESAEIIKKQLVNVEIIIVTAFSHFEYAKRAINLGISNYLLKPITNEEFFNALDKVLKKIEDTKKIATQQIEINDKLRKLMPLLEKEIIARIIYDVKTSENQLNEYKRLLEVTKQECMCIIFAIDDKDYFSEDIFSALKMRLKARFYKVIGGIFLKDIVFLVFDKNIDSIYKSEDFAKSLNDIKRDIKTRFNLEVREGIGASIKDFGEVYKSYSEAKDSVSRKVNNNEGNNLDDEIKSYVYEKENSICGKIINEDYEGAIKELTSFLNYLVKKQSNIDMSYLKKRFKHFSLLVNRNISNFFEGFIEPFDIEWVEGKIDRTENISEIEQYMKGFIKEAIFNINYHKQDRDTRVIGEVKDFIRENYMKDISLNDVAEYIDLSPYYLSKLFKKVEGINFKDYLIKLKMEKAKELLRKEGRTIKETALEIGYSDPNYFSRAFKKYVGITASEYSNL